MIGRRVVLLCSFLTALVGALPQPSQHDSLIVIEEFETEFGNVTWYGDAVEKRSPATLNRRCGSNSVSCSGSHQGSASTCAQLIVSVAGPRSGQSIPSSPRSFCLSGSGGNCCISWASVVSNAVYGDLTSAAQKVNNQCQTNGVVSGLTRDTQIGSTCTTQCLSNRPEGCS